MPEFGIVGRIHRKEGLGREKGSLQIIREICLVEKISARFEQNQARLGMPNRSLIGLVEKNFTTHSLNETNEVDLVAKMLCL